MCREQCGEDVMLLVVYIGTHLYNSKDRQKRLLSRYTFNTRLSWHLYKLH